MEQEEQRTDDKQELTEDQLDEVAGGDTPQPFMEFKLQEVYITAVSAPPSTK